jgi:hypothetical protein
MDDLALADGRQFYTHKLAECPASTSKKRGPTDQVRATFSFRQRVATLYISRSHAFLIGDHCSQLQR